MPNPKMKNCKFGKKGQIYNPWTVILVTMHPTPRRGSRRAGVPYQEGAVSLDDGISWIGMSRATKWKPSTRTRTRARTRGEAVDSGDDVGPRTQVEVEVKWT